LDGDHHSVGHAFGAYVGVLDVGDVDERAVLVLTAREAEPLRLLVALEELLVGLGDLELYVLRRVARLYKEVAVLPCRMGTVAVGRRRRSRIRSLLLTPQLIVPSTKACVAPSPVDYCRQPNRGFTRLGCRRRSEVVALHRVPQAPARTGLDPRRNALENARS
jgi:hypothetical protein